MSSNKAFQIAFLISLISHGIILFQNPNLNLNIFSKNKIEQNLEVSYIKKPQDTKEHLKAPNPKKEPFLQIPSKIASFKTTPPPYIDKEDIFNKNREISQKNIFTKPILIKPDIIAVKKKIVLPPIDTDKISNPSYMSYYQLVRERIRRAAYQNYSRAETGEVYFSFVIFSNGALKEVQLVEEKSSSSQYLKGVALRSIKEAASFPAFPKELDYPQLSFNVVISFEIE